MHNVMHLAILFSYIAAFVHDFVFVYVYPITVNVVNVVCPFLHICIKSQVEAVAKYLEEPLKQIASP